MDASNRKNIIILSAALVLVTLGFGMVIPLFPFYIEALGGRGTALGLLIAIAALMELLLGPVWGNLSDRIGRKPVLIIGLFGYAFSSLFMGLSTKLWMLFAGRALSGVLSSATMAAALAYIGDSTSEEDRGGGMGVLGAMSGLGIILGPGFGGWLAADALSTPFFVSAGLSLLTVCFALLLLPESLPPAARLHITRDVQRLRVSTLWHALAGPIGIVFFILFLASFGLANFEAVFGLYALEKFNYGPEQVGMILTVVGLVSTAGKLFTGVLTRRWGDVSIIKVSLLTGSLGYLVLLAANTYLTVLLATGFFILSKTFLRPSVLSLISKRAEGGQGMSMGLSNSFMSLGRIVGPIWAGLVFDINVHYPYLSGSALLFVGFLVSLVTIASQKTARPEAASR
jgi:DHA1 family multidrug resistance protein-like MFS transporter